MSPFPLLVVLLVLSAVQCEAWTLDEHGSPIDPPQNDDQGGIGPCQICQMIIGKVLKSIGNELSKDKAEKALDKICDLSKALKNPCIRFIKKFRPMLVHVITSGKRPQQACKQIHLC